MKTSLSAERLRELLKYNRNTGVFTWRVTRGKACQGFAAGSFDARGYIVIGVDGSYYKAHRLAWLYVYGVWPEGELDHKDRNRSNNRIKNLRPATRLQNTRNTAIRSDNSSGHRGVSWHKAAHKWSCGIHYNGRWRHLGLFENIDLAVEFRTLAEELIDPTFYRSRKRKEYA